MITAFEAPQPVVAYYNLVLRIHESLYLSVSEESFSGAEIVGVRSTEDIVEVRSPEDVEVRSPENVEVRSPEDVEVMSPEVVEEIVVTLVASVKVTGEGSIEVKVSKGVTELRSLCI